MRQALLAAGFHPGTLGAPGPDGLLVGPAEIEQVSCPVDESDLDRAREYLSDVAARWPSLLATQRRWGLADNTYSLDVLDRRHLVAQAVDEQFTQELAGNFLASAFLNETHLLGDEGDRLAASILTDADALLADSLTVAVPWQSPSTTSRALGTLYVAAHVHNLIIEQHVEGGSGFLRACS